MPPSKRTRERAPSCRGAMTRGVYSILYPAEVYLIQPDILVVPVLSFDLSFFRLSYGGGFYDRTLAFTRRVLTIGIGFELARLETIYPPPYDLPMDLVVTERGITQRQALEPRCEMPLYVKLFHCKHEISNQSRNLIGSRIQCKMAPIQDVDLSGRNIFQVGLRFGDVERRIVFAPEVLAVSFEARSAIGDRR